MLSRSCQRLSRTTLVGTPTRRLAPLSLSLSLSLSSTSMSINSTPCRTRSNSTSTYPLFRLDPPTAEEELSDFNQQISSITEWFKSPRFQRVKRPYSAELVATKRGTQPISGSTHPSNISAKKLWALLERAASASASNGNGNGKPLHTMGAIDPVQMTQMAKYLDVLYVSGWAASSVLTTGFNEVGPDLADYPYTTVPNQVQRMRKAQELHDRKMWDERRSGGAGKQEWIDYLRPIIADGDTGHGGLSSVMKLAKAFGEAGVSAVHFEDQLHGGKNVDIKLGKFWYRFPNMFRG